MKILIFIEKRGSIGVYCPILRLYLYKNEGIVGENILENGTKTDF